MKYIYIAIFYIAIIAVTFFGAHSCQHPKNKYTSPARYNFKDPDKFNMPSSLLEISGIAFHNGNSDTVYSIQDEDGKLFKQLWDIKKQTHVKFAPNGDFEDLAILGDQVFVLNSHGSLFSFPISEMGKKETSLTKETQDLLPKAEYESLYADEKERRLYILCKNCDIDKKTKKVTGYVLKYHAEVDSLALENTFNLDLSQLKALDPKLKTSLSPSALTRNTKTNEWFILSSANKLLVVTDAQWKIKAAHKLNSSTFNQPEGIAFDKDQHLFISNEGDEVNDGNILKFKYGFVK